MHCKHVFCKPCTLVETNIEASEPMPFFQGTTTCSLSSFGMLITGRWAWKLPSFLMLRAINWFSLASNSQQTKKGWLQNSSVLRRWGGGGLKFTPIALESAAKTWKSPSPWFGHNTPCSLASQHFLIAIWNQFRLSRWAWDLCCFV